MRRVSISDIMRETGLSRATVDRVLNGRGNVHSRTREVVEETLSRLRRPVDNVVHGGAPVDIVLRVGSGMMKQMRAAWERARQPGQFRDMYQAQEPDMLSAVAELCRATERPLIITAKNSDALAEILAEARSRGKRVITLISDLAPQARDCFVGIDDRGAGQTAAFLVGRALGDRPTTVGVVVGDTAFRCHEDREIGFRTGLRSHFPKIVLAAEARGEDSPVLTRDAVLALLRQQPALAAIYNVGGGNMGLVEAIREAGRADDLLLVCHEVNRIIVPLLREGRADFAISGNPAGQLAESLRLATAEKLDGTRDTTHLDFGVYTRFNLPAFAQSA